MIDENTIVMILFLVLGVNAATKYHYRIEEQDRINGLSSSSDIVEVCTNPPAPQSVDYTIDTETMQAEIAWVMPSGVYGQQMIFEVTTDKENKQRKIIGQKLTLNFLSRC